MAGSLFSPLRYRWLLLPPLLVLVAGAGLLYLQKEPLSDGYLAEGQALMEQGQHRLALGKFSMAILFSPRRDAAYLARARAFEALRAPRRAVTDLDAAIRLAPQQPELYHLRGLLLGANLHRWRAALRDFDTVLRLRPDDAAVYFERGRAYDQINNPHQAVKDYSRALALDPDLTEAYLERARMRWRMRHYAGEIADLTAALRLRPGAPDVLMRRADAYLATHDFAAALADLEQVLRVYPDHHLYFKRGTAHLNLRHYRAAIADFSRALRTNRFAIAAYYNRAHAYAALGDTARALRDWAIVCELQATGQSEACYQAELAARQLRAR